jgi:hypothetical protein
MTLFFALLGALFAVGAIVALRLYGVVASLPGLVMAAAAFGIASLAHTVGKLRARIEMLERRAPAVTTAAGALVDAPGPHSDDAQKLLDLAGEQHAERMIGNAKKLYQDVVAEFPGTSQAAAARRALEEIERETKA